jgi:hypothetical protein
MKMKFALLALAGTASASLASVVIPGTLIGTASFTGVSSRDAQGTATNDMGMAVIGSGGTVASVRAFGTLNRVASGTFASEARVRFSAGAGNSFTAFNYQHSTVGGYPTSGVVNFDTTTNVTPFTLNAGGTVNFEWFESFQDGTAGLPESTFNPVTYEFRTAATIQNGNFNLGTINPDGVQVCSAPSANVAGGLDFYTFTLAGPGALTLSDYVNIQVMNTAGGVAYDTEIAIYDGMGNKLNEDDDDGVSFYSQLSYGTADPLAAAASGVAGQDGATLAAGTYTIVVGGFNTTFPSTLSGTFTPGTAAGNHQLCIQYVPTPGTVALAGLAGLFAARRRRA